MHCNIPFKEKCILYELRDVHWTSFSQYHHCQTQGCYHPCAKEGACSLIDRGMQVKLTFCLSLPLPPAPPDNPERSQPVHRVCLPLCRFCLRGLRGQTLPWQTAQSGSPLPRTRRLGCLQIFSAEKYFLQLKEILAPTQKILLPTWSKTEFQPPCFSNSLVFLSWLYQTYYEDQA